ncbi:MAG TPA: TetR family transcriptional regulator [Rhizomicrobium sp.]|jgi:AcrR family transcriptional regulator|nr:TetR family transcriptional regulator [Rhizomicrobium sp.]
MSSQWSRRDISAEATRAAIIASAWEIFVRDGFAAASLVEIARAANATTGAIYHHFKDKKGLFRAVAEAVEQDLMNRTAVIASAETDPWRQLRAGASAMLEIAAEPHIARIIFHEAPTVIGAAQWREIEKRFAFGALIAMLQSLQNAGASRIRNPELTASILLGAFIEAATTVALAVDKRAVLEDARAAILDIIEALRG